MTRDALLTFGDSIDLAALNVGADDGTTTTDIDLVVAAPEIAAGGRTPWIRVQVEVAIEGTSSTVDFQLEDGADDITYVDEAGVASGAIAEASLVPGWFWERPLPDGLLRYLRLNIVVAVADLTAGVITAFIYFRD